MDNQLIVYAAIVATYATIFVLAILLLTRRKPVSDQVAGVGENRPSQWRRAKRLHVLIAIGLAMFFVAHWWVIAPHITHIELIMGVLVTGAMLYHPVRVLMHTSGSQPRWWDFLYAAMLLGYFAGTLVDNPALLLSMGIPVIFLNLSLPVVIWYVERVKKVEIYLQREGYSFHYVYLSE